jgi:hypothetical protein
MKKLTNTFKLAHRNEQNITEYMKLVVEEFHIGHGLSF